MPQLAILQKFERYLELISIEFIDDLNAQPLEPQVFNLRKQEHDSQMVDLKEALQKGHCSGFSLCHGAMDISGKLEWWENALVAINNWNEETSALDTEVILPGADTAETTTLRDLFERGMNYIVPSQDSALTFNGFPVNIKGATQGNVLKPDSGYFELSIKKNGRYEIHTIKSRLLLAGKFSENDIIEFLTEFSIQGKICLIHSTDHTIRIGYDGATWILYDPNFLHDNLSHIHITTNDVESIVKDIFWQLETNSICIEVASIFREALTFPKYELKIKESLPELLEEDGFRLILYYRPDLIAHALEIAKHQDAEGEQIRLAIAKALVKRDVYNNIGFLLIAALKPEYLFEIFDLAKHASGIDIRNALAIVLDEDNKYGKSVFFMLVAQCPRQVVALFELANCVNSVGICTSIANALNKKNNCATTAFQVIVTEQTTTLAPLLALARENFRYEIRASIAKALVDTSPNNWTGWHSLVEYTPESLPQLIELANSEHGLEIQTAIAAALIVKTNRHFTGLDYLLIRAPAMLAPFDACIQLAKANLVTQFQHNLDQLQQQGNIPGILGLLEDIIRDPRHFLKYQNINVRKGLFENYGAANSYREVVNYGIDKLVSVLDVNAAGLDNAVTSRLEQLENATKPSVAIKSKLRQALDRVNNPEAVAQHDAVQKKRRKRR